MSRPSDAPDGWWLAVLWVADEDGVVSFRDVAPDAGPPPDPPLARLGPAISGALSGPDPRGRRAAPDATRADRPARRPGPARGASRWRSGSPSGSSRRGRRRCVRTSSPRRSSTAFVRAVEGLQQALNGRGQVDSADRCATCSTTSWRSSASARRRRAARIRGPSGQRPPDPDDDDDDRARPDDADDESGNGGSGDRPTTTTRPATDTGGDRPETIRMPVVGAGDRAAAARAVRMTAQAIARPVPAGASASLWSSLGPARASSCCSASGSTCGPTSCGTRASASIRSSGRGSERDGRAVLGGVPGRARRAPRQPLAGRPPVAAADGGGGWPFRSLIDRLNEAAQAADTPSRPRPGSHVRWRPDPFGDVRSPGPIVFDDERHARPRPARPAAILGALALFIAIDHRRLGVGGVGDRPAVDPPRPVLARRRRSPTRSSTATSASSCSSCRSCASSRACSTASSSPRLLLVAGALPRRCLARRARVHDRRSASTWRSSAACSCCRSRSATSSTSSSCRTAPAASRPASATPTRTPSSSPSTC